MDAQLHAQKLKPGFITSSNWVLIGLATGLFPRVLMMVKFPSAVNFLHFLVVPFACGVVLVTAKMRDPQQTAITKRILAALGILLTIYFASALLNSAGVINALLQFLLFNEPFLLLLAIVALPLSPDKLDRFRKWILGFGFSNLLFALVQKFVLKWDTCGCSPGGWGDGDAIKGLFLNQGAGHVVGGSVSASLAPYFFFSARNQPLWVRLLVVFATLLHIVIADTKQVLLVAIISFIILSLSKVQEPLKVIFYLMSILAFIGFFYWAISNIEFLQFYNTWNRPELYGPDGEVTKMKLLGIQVIIQKFHSPLNWLLGLGPGHTVSRLGGWMLKDFSQLLDPLGATHSDVFDSIMANAGESWLAAQGSTMFSPFWGWVALWGDIGWLGFAAYLYVCALVWIYLADDLSKFLMINVFTHGVIFTQMEEPGYMLFIAALIGLRSQELRRDRIAKRFAETNSPIGSLDKNVS